MAKRSVGSKSFKKKETTETVKVDNKTITVKRLGSDWKVLKGGEK